MTLLWLLHSLAGSLTLWPRRMECIVVGIPGLQKQFLRLIESPSPAHGNTWQDFVLSANHRIDAVPECPGAAFVQGPRAWWACEKVIPDFAICEACYLDKVEPSQWHEMFTPAHQPSSEMWNCSFANLPIQISWDLALSDAARDFDDFWKCAWAAATLPSCEGQVVNGGEWFKLFNVDNFGVCRTCYHAWTSALRFESHFHREQDPEGRLFFVRYVS